MARKTKIDHIHDYTSQIHSTKRAENHMANMDNWDERKMRAEDKAATHYANTHFQNQWRDKPLPLPPEGERGQYHTFCQDCRFFYTGQSSGQATGCCCSIGRFHKPCADWESR
jgi:hypothetical protein